LNPFFSFSHFLSRPAPSETPEGYRIPFDLTQDEWVRFKEMAEHADWGLFLKVLDNAAKFEGEAILGASTDENLHYHRGFVMGLRKSAFIVEEARRDEQAYLTDQKNARKRAASGDTSIALFGSPGWRPQRQRAAGRG